MAHTQLSITPASPSNQGFDPLCKQLISDGLLTKSNAVSAQEIAIKGGQRLADVLTIRFGIAALSIAEVYSQIYQTQLLNPHESLPTPSLVHKFGPAHAARTGLLPWRRMGADTVVLTDSPDQFARNLAVLTAHLGPVRMAITTTEYIEKYLIEHCQDTLVHAAETKVPQAQSSRMWRAKRTLAVGVAILFAFGLAAVFLPDLTFTILVAWAILILILTTGLKAAAAYACISAKSEDIPHAVTPARLPKITLLVPLFRETEIAGHLLARLREIDYPHELLDVCLVTEGDDLTTRDALGKTVLPTWMRSVIVPAGTLRTKPRALNFALDFARGSIIGVYDAEDAPAPDQLRAVAFHFANCSPDVACLQGILDYYNDSTN
tara:strand:- start:13555 stop:14688 length:1134 start_codon:yes stop_codon:yes gene_type:complete